MLWVLAAQRLGTRDLAFTLLRREAADVAQASSSNGGRSPPSFGTRDLAFTLLRSEAADVARASSTSANVSRVMF